MTDQQTTSTASERAVTGEVSRRRSLGDEGCSTLHVDMDAFFASVEVRRRPELAGRPVIVGGTGARSVVMSATYEARAFGVHSAMPILRARRLCPDAVIVPPDLTDYGRVSAGVMEIFRSITPQVQPLSLDEAFLDVSGVQRRWGRARQIAELIRARVADEQGLTCSVGVAPTMFVAKLASTRSKPDGLLVVPADGVIEFLHPLPVEALWGVGERTAEQLLRLGLRTVGDLARVPRQTLERALGRAAGAQLAELAWGRDPRRVSTRLPDKSVGADETFASDVDDPAVIHRELLRLSQRTARRLRAGGHEGRTVTVRVRFSDFTTITRSRTLTAPTDVTQHIYGAARELFDALRLERARIRLVGVRVEGLIDAGTRARQLALDEPSHGWRDAEAAVDRATRRFGTGAVRPATLVEPATGRESARDPATTALDHSANAP